MKKAQAQQVIIYAMGIVIVGLLLIFGYRAIKNLGDQQEEIKAIEFRIALENDIKGIGFGDVRIREYNIPAGFDAVFVSDPGHFGPSACFPTPAFETDHPIVADAITTTSGSETTKDNIFLTGEIAPDSFFVEKLKLGDCPSGGELAVIKVDPKNGKIKLRLEGKGRTVLVSAASS